MPASRPFASSLGLTFNLVSAQLGQTEYEWTLELVYSKLSI